LKDDPPLPLDTVPEHPVARNPKNRLAFADAWRSARWLGCAERDRGGGRRQMAKRPAVTVIIVGFRSRRYLDRCLPSVLQQAFPGEVEVLFVDNASRDGSAEYVRQTFPSVTVVESGVNLGYGGGNNLGAERARGEILVFLNPDTEAADGWLMPLVQPLLGDADVGLTTSKILLMDERETINACGNDISLSGITWCRGFGRPANEFTVDADVSAVSGCSFAIRANLFQQLGGFDPSFFTYLEDTELSWRARAEGYRCQFVAASVVYHDFRLSFSPAKIRWIERNRYRMLARHLSLRALLALAPTLALAEVLTWGYAAARGPSSFLAKAHATAWAATLIRPHARPVSPKAEAWILRQHSPRPPMVSDAGGQLGRAVQSGLGPLFDAAARLALALLPVSPGNPADRHCQAETVSTDGNVGQDGSIRGLREWLAGGSD
jgi:GT2 family glycosyltransferase